MQCSGNMRVEIRKWFYMQHTLHILSRLGHGPFPISISNDKTWKELEVMLGVV